MRSYDGAEVCELSGIFMLSLTGNNIRLYRDDGLAIFKTQAAAI